MKYTYLSPLLIMGLFFIGKGEAMEDKPINQSQCASQKKSLYLTEKGDVTEPIVILLGLTGIRIKNDSTKVESEWPDARIHVNSRSLEDVVPATQGKVDPSLSWLGDLIKERWEKDPKKINMSKTQAGSIIRICSKDLQQEETSSPQITKPKAILFLGAALPRVRARLAYLNGLYDKKEISPSLPVYVLTGERELDEKIGETPFHLMNSANGIISFRKDWQTSNKDVFDEGEMMKLVFSQSRHNDLKEENVHFVYSPKGSQRRATTESTVKQWLEDFSPESGKYIAISNQPYNFYQEAVINRVLLQSRRSDICVEAIGPSMEIKKEDESQTIEQAKNFLNNTSRILYELLEIKKTTN